MASSLRAIWLSSLKKSRNYVDPNLCKVLMRYASSVALIALGLLLLTLSLGKPATVKKYMTFSMMESDPKFESWQASWRDRCSLVSAVENINMPHNPTHLNGFNRIYILLTRAEENVFHQAWFYLQLIPHIMEMKIKPLARSMSKSAAKHQHTNAEGLRVQFWLHPRMDWLAQFVHTYPHGLPNVNVGVQMLSYVDYDPEADFPNLNPNLESFFANHPDASRRSCVLFSNHIAPNDRFFPDTQLWTKKELPQNQFFRRIWLPVIRTHLGLPPPSKICTRVKPHVLFIERKHSRVLFDHETRSEVYLQLEGMVLGMNMTISRVWFEELTVLEQARRVGNANIVVGAHGAGLTNAIFLPDCTQIQQSLKSALIEISFRFGWCQKVSESDRRNASKIHTRANLLKAWHLCPQHSRYYNKADYFALTSTVGHVRYLEVVNYETGRLIKFDDNPIHTDRLVTSAKAVSKEVWLASKDSSYDVFSQLQYDGIEPYSVR
uniref:Glycosyltransferase 61 catalytic domain-containing protein n=1 Tax=Amorphochlora amoebiformis TaxID=1561963 RepID=A0A7S0H5U3_9EUKA|mmetsp:Transcript_4691/g.7147  ORF Transcript_4691/g.7147 Transcript_4691/m.7147 type:complete len:492 (+) Transcript_4691:210-1685(+)